MLVELQDGQQVESVIMRFPVATKAAEAEDLLLANATEEEMNTSGHAFRSEPRLCGGVSTSHSGD